MNKSLRGAITRSSAEYTHNPQLILYLNAYVCVHSTTHILYKGKKKHILHNPRTTLNQNYNHIVSLFYKQEPPHLYGTFDCLFAITPALSRCNAVCTFA